MDIKLKIIPKPEPKTRTVIILERGKLETAFRGEGEGKGNINLLCGNCNSKLAKNIHEGAVRNIVIKCAICGLYNDIP